MILCSQSGETKDLHRCLKVVKESNYDIFTIGVVNVVNSLISREVDCGCYLHAGREVGVASTKSFTSQCVVLTLIALWFSYAHIPDELTQKRAKILQDIRQLENSVSTLLYNEENSIICDLQHELRSKIVPLFTNKQSCFVLGKGRGEAVARRNAPDGPSKGV